MTSCRISETEDGRRKGVSRGVKFFLLLCLWVFAGLPAGASASNAPNREVLVLCYHSILPKVPPGDTMSVSQQQFGAQLEYLKVNGFTPVSVETLLAVSRGEGTLPPKAVLISFDDAYQSFYHIVRPMLKKYNYPSMLAVVGNWIEGNPPQGLTEPLMTWAQIREVAQGGNVEVVSHSFDLHRSVRYNPIGNVGSVVSVPEYFSAGEQYETEVQYRRKLQNDFQMQNRIFKKKVGRLPRVIVWPYGRYNAVGIDLARKNGFALGFTLSDGKASLEEPHRMNRLLMSSMPVSRFIFSVNHPEHRPYPIRAMQVDLDLIYDPESEEQTDRNLGKLIDRLVALKVNTVYLQAFSDIKGTGNIQSVYFQNSVLPVKADIFSHAVHQMIIRGMLVYAWMPTLSFRFPDPAFAEKWRVRSYMEGETRPSKSWYERLTPFSPEVRSRIGELYESLAARAQIHGVLFQDDAYLAEREDHHPEALAAFSKHIGRPVTSREIIQDPKTADQWTAFKTRSLIEYVETLSKRVRKYRPEAMFARNLYANVLIKPHSEFWFAQSYDQFIESYDQVVVMAYPQMENAGDPIGWLKGLAEKVAAHPKGPDKTVFKIQAYDWQDGQWIDSGLLLDEMQTILAKGGRHLAYYPDNLWVKQPVLHEIQQEMSTRTADELAGIHDETGIPPY